MGLWDSVEKGVSAVGSAVKSGASTVEDVASEVADGVEDFGDLVGGGLSDVACANPNNFICDLASGGGGLLSGSASWMAGLIGGAGRIVEGAGSAVGSALQGRWRDSAEGLFGAIIGAASLGVESVTLLGRWIDETQRHRSRNRLRVFVTELIDDAFIADERTQARELAGVDRRPWGVRLDVQHRLLSFSSSDVPLRDLHDQGHVDLYELAGFDHYPSWRTPRPTALVHRTSHRARTSISREDLDSFVQTGSPGITVLALSPRHASKSMRYAERICRDVGVRLHWDQGEHAVHDVTSLDPFKLDGEDRLFPLHWSGNPDPVITIDPNPPPDPSDPFSEFLRNEGFHDGSGGAECDRLLTFGVLSVYEGDEPHSGVLEGVTLDENNPIPCDDRDDACCASLERAQVGSGLRGSAVAYSWPRNSLALLRNRFILAHEIGHWLGLCHQGHRRLTEIMYNGKTSPSYRSPLTPVLLGRGAQRPRFTTSDGESLWRFLIAHRLKNCVQPGPSPVD